MTGISQRATTPEAAVWRGFTHPELDRAYDNAGHVRDSAARLAGWTARSRVLRAGRPQLLDLAYGPRERNRTDIFRCGAPDAPLFVFIHGGYWQRNSKEVFSCMAEGPLARGFDVAVPGYTLGPEASLTEIVAEIRAAIGWLREHGPALGVATGPLVAGGWSAGGHLAALASAWPGVDAALPISGIYDLEPIRLGVLNDKLGLTEDEVARLSPLRQIAPGQAPIAALAGGAELPELKRQTVDYVAACRQAGLSTGHFELPELNHFTILDELVAPLGCVTEVLVQLLGRLD